MPVYNLNRFLLLTATILVYNVYSELFVKESTIDPFSLLFEKQRILIDRIDSIADRLQSLEEARSDEVNLLRINGWHTEEKLGQIYSGVSNMEEKLNTLSNDFHQLKSFQSKKEKKETDCNCFSISKLTSLLYPEEIEKLKEDESNPAEKTMKDQPAPIDVKINQMNFVPISDDENGTMLESEPDLESLIKEVGMTLNANLEYAMNQLKDIILQAFKNSEQHQQNNELLLAKSHEAMPKVILKLMAINQHLIEKQITKSIKEEIQLLKEALSSEESDEIRNTIDTFSLRVRANSSTLDESSEVSDNVTYDASLLNLADNDSLVLETSLNHTSDAAQWVDIRNDSDTGNETFIADSINSVVTFINGMKNFMADGVSVFSEESNYIDNQINSYIHPKNVDEPKDNSRNKSKEDTFTLDTICGSFNATSYEMIQKMNNLKTTLIERLKKAEEQIMGFKIYQTSALHSHMKEIKFEFAELKEELSRTISRSVIKLGKKVDSTKHSLFAFMNGAVTSITSSTVASSKATGFVISKTLRNIFQKLQTKFLEMSWFSTGGCPGLYQKVGTSCLLIIENMKAPWRETCNFCSSLGGIIPTVGENDLILLKQLLANETEGVWLRTENSITYSDNCREENSINLSSDSLKMGQRLCSAFMGDGTLNDDISCSTNLSVVCQIQNVEPANINNDFNITRALADLDLFLKNSKYYKFKKGYL